MPFNLITTAWIPVRLRNGSQAIIRPAQILENICSESEVVFPDWPRPDLNIATLELLIGLVSCAMPPETDEAWSDIWFKSPTVTELDKALAHLIPAFNLDGPEQNFLQDFDTLEGESIGMDGLFLDSAGDSTAKKNADLMVKRKRYARLARPTATIALYALQQFAPSGGAGHRTSMRGGGPMTTLALPSGPQKDDHPALWSLIWANVLPQSDSALAREDFPLVFPWMAETLTSENGQEIHGEGPSAHRLQAFFGMPRRIRLDFAENEDGSPHAGAARHRGNRAAAYYSSPSRQ